MATQVNITLKALNGNHNCPQRSMTLTHERSIIQIGRASKSPNKNLLEGVNNAWFDSPVMSRCHAELIFDSENTTLSIRDVGSMHGTFLSGNTRLETGIAKTLDCGAILVFGAEVKRGKDVFPACVFTLEYDMLPTLARTTIGYAFPDSSDIEDEEEYGFSDMEIHDEVSPSLLSDGGESIINSIIKASQAVEPIDLTGDDFEVATSRKSQPMISPVSLTSQPTIGHFRVHVSPASQNEPIIVESDDSDDEVDGFLSDSDDPSVEAHSNTGELSTRVFRPGSDGLPELDVDDSIDVEVNNHYPLDALHDDMSDLPCDVEFTSGSEFGCESDNNSECSLSEAGRDGIRALLDGDLLSKDSGSVWESRGIEPSLDFQGVSNGPIEHPHELASTNTEYVEKVVTDRQPSPSDAAMVKPTVLPVPRQVAEISMSNERPWRQITVQSLGDKTGKHDFFEARDINKSVMTVTGGTMGRPTLMPQESMCSTCPELTPVRLIATPRGSWARRLRMRSESAESQFSGLEMSQCGVEDVATRSAAPLSYLDNHAQAPAIIDRTPSPEHDLTSAVKYNESKATMAAANKTAAIFSSRSALRINDIIDEVSLPEQTSRGIKRKAYDISGDGKDIQAWTKTNLPLQVPMNFQTEYSDVDVASDSIQLSEAVAQKLPELIETRPAKRFKGLVERLGYIAFGGVAVGSALFSVLVATAPEFL